MVVALLEADEDDRDLTEEHSSSETAIDGLGFVCLLDTILIFEF